ncbi:SseB family protein [Streptomyces sp. VRA16 Mangrove soil]|uniref:SseB family protein n=1 Tax=Streptomyces sp. VRA16 Mangrove soil TaxID=2817434 RepID=UPI001A9D07B1|nr:SseB family protein [Streptomyces sp. VRA16 Mangrove soil]MBO1337420.1 SseB family protein [Streptomyces sp. VRA16 Mangrove soil]
MKRKMPNANRNAAQQALSALAEDTGNEAALKKLADCYVLLPVADEATDAQRGHPDDVVLPVLQEPDGQQMVPVFTSEERLNELLPFITHYRRMPLHDLADHWPPGDVSLAVDAASPEALTFNADAIRTRLAHVPKT